MSVNLSKPDRRGACERNARLKMEVHSCRVKSIAATARPIREYGCNFLICSFNGGGGRGFISCFSYRVVHARRTRSVIENLENFDRGTPTEEFLVRVNDLLRVYIPSIPKLKIPSRARQPVCRVLRKRCRRQGRAHDEAGSREDRDFSSRVRRRNAGESIARLERKRERQRERG